MCLKTWLSRNQNVFHSADRKVTTYSYRSFHCELCKTRFKEKIPHPMDEQTYVSPIDLFRPKQNYVILESYIADYGGILPRQPDSISWQRDIHVLNFDETTSFNQNGADHVKIGRGSMNELRVNDISVSRLHAFIRRDASSGAFYLQDNQSRFGSIVKVNHPITLEEGQEYYFQQGRSMFNIKAGRESGLFFEDSTWRKLTSRDEVDDEDSSTRFYSTVGQFCGVKSKEKAQKLRKVSYMF